MWDEIPEDVFTIVTVDNFDMLKSYSAVYCGDQSRSYHGTTIQLVQPDSSIIYQRQTRSIQAELPVNRRRPSSSGNSPHKLGKDGPKRTCTRTVIAKDLTNRSVTIYIKPVTNSSAISTK